MLLLIILEFVLDKAVEHVLRGTGLVHGHHVACLEHLEKVEVVGAAEETLLNTVNGPRH